MQDAGWVGFVFNWLGFLFSIFQDRVSLYSSVCPGTCSIDQAGLELIDLPASGIKGMQHQHLAIGQYFYMEVEKYPQRPDEGLGSLGAGVEWGYSELLSRLSSPMHFTC